MIVKNRNTLNRSKDVGCREEKCSSVLVCPLSRFVNFDPGKQNDASRQSRDSASDVSAVSGSHVASRRVFPTRDRGRGSDVHGLAAFGRLTNGLCGGQLTFAGRGGDSRHTVLGPDVCQVS